MNIVHLTDCMDFMADKPDKYYDLAIVDPPHGIGDWTNSNSSYTNKSGGFTKIKRNRKAVTWNNETPPKEYFEAINRISKNQIIWGANYYNCFNSIGGALIWHKGKRGFGYSSCEIASLSFQKRVDYVLIDWQSGFSRQQKENVIHPCQKPVALYKWLLQNYAKPGQTIWDSHVGSGSIRIACHDLGFDLESCEIDPDYWQAQEERYNNHIQQGGLFEKEEIQELVYTKGQG